MVKLLHFIFLFNWGTRMGPLSHSVETIQYKTVGDELLSADIHRPLDEKIYPGVILVHGGSWGGRSREDMSGIAEFLASHGFVVMNISYRFAPKHRYPAQIEDAHDAIEWFKKHADKFKLDPTRLGAWGYSAGGHIITQWAFLESKKQQAPALGAIVSGGAPYDLSWYPFSPIITHLLDGFRDQRLQEYKEASPINHISPHAPAMLLIHAEQDRLVEAVQSSNLQNKLRDVGVDARLSLVSYWGHKWSFILADEAVSEGLTFLKEKLH